MTFAVENLRDLVQLLEKQPEWRTELRRVLLTEEVLSLPSTVRALVETQRQLVEAQHQSVEAQRRTDEHLTILTQRVDSLAQQMQQQAQRGDTQAQQLEVLTQRVDSLTQQVEILTRRVDSLAQQVEILTRRVDSLTQQVEILTQRVDDLTRRVDSLTEQVQNLTFRVDALTRNVDRLVELTDFLRQDVSSLKGDNLERKYREKGHAYFGRIVRHTYVLSGNEVSALVYRAADEGKISNAEADDLILADVILRGRRREDGTEVYLVVEVSSVIDPHDLQRATERAQILAKLGTPTLPVVAGLSMTTEATIVAKQMQIWQVLDGRTYAPNGV
jgi:archaellum component FlaC